MSQPIADSVSNAGTAGYTTSAADSARQAWLNFIQIPEHFEIEKTAAFDKPVLGNLSGRGLADYFTRYRPVPGKDSVRHISSAWKDGRNTIAEVESFSKPAVPSDFDSLTDAGLLILLAVFFLFAADRILKGTGRAFDSMMNLKRQEETERDMNSKLSRNTAFMFLILTLSLVISRQIPIRFAGEGVPSALLYLYTSGGIFLYIVLKRFIFSVMDYVNECDAFRILNYMGYTYLIAAASMILAGELLYFLIPNIPGWLITTWIAVSCGIPALLYLLIGANVLHKNRFSLFFYILYLCVLEVLPVILIVKIL